MENKQLLSICLPTYNRDYLLSETLKRICPLTKKYDIEVFISDNASVDNTEQVVTDFIKVYSNINYIKQSANVGADKNFEQVLLCSTTKYRWLLGDGCIFDEESLVTVIEDLKNNDYDVLVTGGNGNRVQQYPSKIYTDPKELLRSIGWHMTWLSALIYNERVLKQAYFARYYSSRFIQMGIIFEYFSIYPCCVKFNSHVLVEFLKIEKKNHWISSTYEVFCRDWYLFIMSLPVFYSFEDKNKCLVAHGEKSLLFLRGSIITHRLNNIYNWGIYRRYKFFIHQTIKLNKLLIVFIAILPPFMIKSIRKIKYIL